MSCRSRGHSRTVIPNEPSSPASSSPTSRSRRYYTRWRVSTRECLDLRLLELMPPLAALCPPATVIDKTRYSALAEPGLVEHLRRREADALCSSSDDGHNMLMRLSVYGTDRDRRCRENSYAVGMTFDPSSGLGVAPPAYLSFSAMLRCSLRWGSVVAAQLFRSELSPFFEYASKSETASWCAFSWIAS
jgi:hypothetical protein